MYYVIFNDCDISIIDLEQIIDNYIFFVKFSKLVMRRNKSTINAEFFLRAITTTQNIYIKNKFIDKIPS